MRDHTALLRALEYIEAHITDELEPADAARYCHLSLSALQKLFRRVFDYSVKEYIAKRRLTLAARELAAAGGSVLELALKYGYARPETFARAFRRLWGVSPSEFRKSAVAVDLFPPLRLEEGENDRLVYRENQMLYDRLLQCPDSAVVCFDLVGLKEINRISRSDGDRAILEAARRIAGLCTGTERLFRLGADEFALLTEGSCTALYRRACRCAARWNQQPLLCKGRSIPVVLRVWAGRCRTAGSGQQAQRQLLENVKHAGRVPSLPPGR